MFHEQLPVGKYSWFLNQNSYFCLEQELKQSIFDVSEIQSYQVL